MNKKQKKILYRIGITILLLVVLALVKPTGYLALGLYLIPYLVIGYDVLKKAAKGIGRGRVFDENFLMGIATVGAFALGAYKTGDYMEAIAVMLFYQVGEVFEGYAIGKSRKNIRKLMDIRPDYANILVDGKLQQVDPSEVSVGSEIVVLTGEKIPIDGIVLEGTSSLNTSALTGESLPRDVWEGAEVISGCVNLTGRLVIKTTKAFEDSTVSKVLELVENASSRKSKSENFISKFARIYTPVVCYAALALAVIPPVISGLLLSQGWHWDVWVYRALSFLVASCPCALVISIPLSFFAGIGGASAQGILIKGSNYMEVLAKTGVVVFDKTGTLTQGVFEVKKIEVAKLDAKITADQLLEYATLAESASPHPISKSLQRAYGKEMDHERVSDIKEITGHGVCALVDGHKVAAGNARLVEHLGIDYISCQEPGTIVYVAIDEAYAGYICIADQMKPTAQEAIRGLAQVGVKKTVMLTGDSEAVAKEVANELGISEVRAQLLPADKVEEVERLLATTGGKKLAFVGDGMNDAPVLSRADVGIAMGAIGSDAAIEAADVVLMDDNPKRLVQAIRIARKCLGIVYQNTIFAIGIKVLTLVLVALGFANMWLAIFADVGVMVLAVLNAIRALFVKKL